MPYFPETSVIKGLVRVVRERRLPPGAVLRVNHAIEGGQASGVTVLMEADILGAYRILDVAAAFKLRHVSPEDLAEIILIHEGQRAQLGQELARMGRGRRTKVLISPVEGVVVRVDGSRIIVQVTERSIEVRAKIPGDIDSVKSEVIRITGVGAIMQCAWGNGGFVYEAYKFLPEDGFAGLSKLDPRISDYRGKVLVSTQSIDKGDLLLAQQQEVAGVVAPSMTSSLREFALELSFPVLLTEGFGQRRPTGLIYTLLRSNMGRQAAFDAVIPDRWSWERPEIMLPLPSGGVFPETPTLDRPLEIGTQVRIMRAPWDGVIGEVVELPPAPQMIENGLRVPSARVRLSNQRVGLVPLANLERLG